MSESETLSNSPSAHPFIQRFQGTFKGVMRWEQLDGLWEVVRADEAKQWYIYAVGEAPPVAASSTEKTREFITHIDELLHKDHEEDYCGIVYTDDFDAPTFIKIFDPHNLGVSCGSSEHPPLPGWVMSTMAPADLPQAFPPPGNRRRWWQKIFA